MGIWTNEMLRNIHLYQAMDKIACCSCFEIVKIVLQFITSFFCVEKIRWIYFITEELL